MALICCKQGIIGYESKHIEDGVLYQAFINTFNAIIENKDYFVDWNVNFNRR